VAGGILTIAGGRAEHEAATLSRCRARRRRRLRAGRRHRMLRPAPERRR
jgi:hypothetical protein